MPMGMLSDMDSTGAGFWRLLDVEDLLTGVGKRNTSLSVVNSMGAPMAIRASIQSLDPLTGENTSPAVLGRGDKEDFDEFKGGERAWIGPGLWVVGEEKALESVDWEVRSLLEQVVDSWSGAKVNLFERPRSLAILLWDSLLEV
jgi:hypothetical protein